MSDPIYPIGAPVESSGPVRVIMQDGEWVEGAKRPEDWRERMKPKPCPTVKHKGRAYAMLPKPGQTPGWKKRGKHATK